MLACPCLSAAFLWFALNGPGVNVHVYEDGEIRLEVAAANTESRAPVGPKRLPDTVRITRSPGIAGYLPASERYTVESRLMASAPSRRDVNRRRTTPLDMTLPIVTVLDGEHVTMSDTGTQRFTVATKAEAGFAVALVREVVVGTTFEVTVQAGDNETVVLDATWLLRGIQEAPTAGSQAIQVNAFEKRVIKSAELGKKVIAEFEEAAWNSRSAGRSNGPPMAIRKQLGETKRGHPLRRTKELLP